MLWPGNCTTWRVSTNEIVGPWILMLSHLGLQVGTKNNGSVWLHALCVTPERISMPFHMTQFTDTFGVLLNVDKVVKVTYENYKKGCVGMQLCHMELQNIRRKNNVIITRNDVATSFYVKVALSSCHVHPGLLYQRQKIVKPQRPPAESRMTPMW